MSQLITDIATSTKNKEGNYEKKTLCGNEAGYGMAVLQCTDKSTSLEDI